MVWQRMQIMSLISTNLDKFCTQILTSPSTVRRSNSIRATISFSLWNADCKNDRRINTDVLAINNRRPSALPTWRE